jgi:hypothetical protein
MADLIELPTRMRSLPWDKHGRPVPWFVAWIDGVPDFRVIGPWKVEHAVAFGQCWICGGPMGSYKAFVIGPMCAVNRTTAEPPCHRDCAVYSARACPFLTTPSMVRRPGQRPAGTIDPAGQMITRNPGVALVWITKKYSRFVTEGGTGYLFRLSGAPEETRWYAHGRPATRAEVLASIDSGLPILQAEADAQGPYAAEQLRQQHAAALPLVPAAGGHDD